MVSISHWLWQVKCQSDKWIFLTVSSKVFWHQPELVLIDDQLWCKQWWPSWCCDHDDVIKWKHFPLYCPFVWGIHQSPVNSPHKDQWRVALMFPLIWAWTNSSANNQHAGDLRCHCSHYDVTVMDDLYFSVWLCYIMKLHHTMLDITTIGADCIGAFNLLGPVSI